jgi:hypothetical protein
MTSFLRLCWYCHICRLLNLSHHNPITNPIPLPNSTPTIWAAARNPINWGSCVYPNYWGSCTQPWLWGLLHATLTIGAAACNTNGWGSRAQPGWVRRCAWASPLRLALRTHGLGFAIAVCSTCSWLGLCPCGLRYGRTTIKWIHLLKLNEFIYFALQNKLIHSFCTAKNLWIFTLNQFIFVWIHIFKPLNSYNIWICRLCEVLHSTVIEIKILH